MKTAFDRIVSVFAGAALLAAALALGDFVLHPGAPDHAFNSAAYRALVALVVAPLNLAIGLLIIRRVPGNIVGPLMLVCLGPVILNSARPDLPLPLLAAFSFLDYHGWTALFLLLLHFPDGRIYPARLAPWLYACLALMVLLTSSLFLASPVIQTPARPPNLFHVAALAPHEERMTRLALGLFAPIMLLALAAPMLRYRRGSPRQRQQIRWLALFGAVGVVYVMVGLVVVPLLTGAEVMNPGTGPGAAFFYLAAGLTPPLAIGLAVLRHRLWDIDVIIRRTLVYSLLTLALTGVYFLSVVALQNLSRLITGQQQPPAVTVLSTLAIAALFTPLRARIQTFIDRRFYRRKYDAERVLARFAAAARDEVDLERLAGSMVGVVQETMQPEHVSLRWVGK